MNEFENIDNQIRANNLFNGNLLAAKNREIQYIGSFGSCHNPSGSNTIDQDTIFELASVSKQFTAYSALKTFKSGNENIDTDIRFYLPDLPYSGITTRNLLNHTSGLPDYFQLFDQHWDKSRIATNSNVLDLLAEFKPEILFLPNHNWQYCNTGYVLLATIIEKIAGSSFAQLFENEICKPLRLANTMIYNRRLNPKHFDNYAFGLVEDAKTSKFVLPDNIPEYNAVYYLDGIHGDGTVNSSVLDLLKWNTELLKPEILDKTIVEQMLTETQIINNKSIEYGMGFYVTHDPNFGKIAYHGGSWPGYSTYNSLYLDKGISIISLCNQPKNLEIEQNIILELESIIFGVNKESTII